jgi:hypothetical protein
MTGLAAVWKVEARCERTFEYGAIRSHGDTPAVGFNEDFVFGRSHTSD